MEKILPIWQPIGWSTHEIARLISEKYNIKTSHTGTLDPMASGVVIVLTGEDRLKKYEYAKWSKTYEFEILFGVRTDTYDALGLIEEVDFRKTITKKDLIPALTSFIGKYDQEVPAYSAIKVKGKSLRHYARKSFPVELPHRQGEIKGIKLVSLTKKSYKKVAKEIISNINKVGGDFRQHVIIEGWEKLVSGDMILVCKIRVEMSKGLYVRSLAQDICKKLNVLGIANNIVRSKNGSYSKENSLNLKDIL